MQWVNPFQGRSQWPRGLRRRSSAARLLRMWVRIPPGAWMFVCCECCVLSGRDLCEGLITRPEDSYRLWRVNGCDQETSNTRRLKPATGLWKIQPQWIVTPRKQTATTNQFQWVRASAKEGFKFFWVAAVSRRDNLIRPKWWRIFGQCKVLVR